MLIPHVMPFCGWVQRPTLLADLHRNKRKFTKVFGPNKFYPRGSLSEVASKGTVTLYLAGSLISICYKGERVFVRPNFFR